MALFAVNTVSFVGIVGAWGYDSPHKVHSVHSSRTSHRAKTTSIDNYLVETSAYSVSLVIQGFDFLLKQAVQGS